MITIVNYGMGNLGSILNMFKFLKIDAEITSDTEEISLAEKILLPGVGSFDRAMERIAELRLKEVLDKKVLIEKIPVLGICLGMQLLTNCSEEGKLPGFGWIDAETIKFCFPNNQIKIPHMGWNLVKSVKSNSFIADLPEESRFYFVHSYYVKVRDDRDSILKTNYGGIEFDSAINSGNIYGAQFHPEKSHKFGMQVLNNFAKL